jgi:hypothetical protein
MRRALLLLTAMALMVVGTAGVALAETTIDTIPQPIPEQQARIGPFGHPNAATIGQVITAPANDTRLDSFTFLLDLPSTVIFRGEVYAWDGQKATGPNLFESAPRSTSGSNDWEEITFNTGGVELVPGQRYILFATISKDYADNVGRGYWARTDAYADGRYHFMSNGSDFDQLFRDSWMPSESDPFPTDTAFRAVFSTEPPLDTTPPEISVDVTGTPGTNDWYTSDVHVDWSVSDPESEISSKSGCDDVSVTTDQAATTYTCEATSAGGTGSDSVTIKRDATAPTLNPSVSPNPVLLNGSATADAGAQDNLSSIASEDCDPVDTTNVGANKSVSCSATDKAGNTNSASASYAVHYKFVGFSSPVDNGSVLNVVKAGQAIPLKWQLTDANNVPVTDLSGATVTASSLSCSLGTTTDRLEEVAAGSSGLQNLGGGYYQFNWKSPASYAKSCKTLNLDMGEGLKRTALFQFSK